jgi:hypothetical protein
MRQPASLLLRWPPLNVAFEKGTHGDRCCSMTPVPTRLRYTSQADGRGCGQPCRLVTAGG